MVRSLVVAILVAYLPFGVEAPAAAQQAAPRSTKKGPATPAKKPAPPLPASPAPVVAPPVEVPAPPTDVTVVTSYTQGAQVSQNTTYIRGGRQRVEFPGMVSIDQCDLQRTILVSPTAKRYRVQPYAEAATPAPKVEPAAMPEMSPFGIVPGGQPGAPQSRPRGGVVAVTTTLTDTLERQQMFGFEARRIKTIVTKEASKDACDKAPMRMEIDAWYVDLPKASKSCARAAAPPVEPAATPADACQDRVESRVVGDVTLGFPVKTVTSMTTGSGDTLETSSTTAEVTSLQISRLEAALFEVPADFVEAKSLLELTPSVAAGATLADALFGSTADGTSAAAPKRAGVVRVGVLEPVNKSTRTTLPTKAVRQELVTRLTKSSYEALPLSGSSPGAIAADMKRLECDYVLVAEVTEVKSSKPGKVGGMLKMASGATPSKDRHEVKMTYRLYPADGSATIKTSGEIKADNGGGFTVGSALKVAAFAGQMYMGFGAMGAMRGFGGMGGLGMGMGMMNPIYSLTSSGGMGAMGGAFFDPRSMAMNSMTMGFSGIGSGTGGFGGMNLSGAPSSDPAEQEILQVALEAAGDVASAVTSKLKGGK